MSTVVKQDFAVGKTVAQKYEGLGFTAQKMVHPPGKLFGLIVGMPGSGKSCFLQSHPGAFIINTDSTSTTNEEPQACIWPGVSEVGQPIDVGGNPLVLTWEEVIKKKEQLIALAKENKPRPETIVVDSLGPALNLVKDHIVKKAGKKHWKELHGPAAWDDAYDTLLRFALEIRQY